MGENMLQKIKHKLAQMKKSHSKKWLLIIGGIVLVFFVAIIVWWVFGRGSASEITTESTISQTQDPLTGRLVDVAHKNQQVYGVMIDEHVDARPQSGIDQAFLVIEAPVEAGIPRLLAFFSEDQQVSKIGPIRSARPYFVDWALEFDALYVHVGGSNEALEKIAKGATFDLNQFWHDPQFWRSTDRFAPHNVYSSTDLLGVYVKKKQGSGRTTDPLYGVWKFKTTEPKDVLPEKIHLSYVSPEYDFSWAYSVEKKAYLRLFDDQPVKTLEGNEIDAQNVVVLLTDVDVIDTVGRRQIRTVGQGTAYLFQDGKKTKVVWKKPTSSERLRFYDQNDVEVEMNPGKTWIEVIEDESQLRTE